ncbi:cupin [Aquicoccus sp. SCR17]|nr:cupin [Carideicomes alvinocaridis]
MDEATRIIEALELKPHPEGGHYRQTWEAQNDGRAMATCIYFLLRAGERSHWHRVDATEIWLWHAGKPLNLLISPDESGPARQIRLGPDVLGGERPQGLVPSHHWQAAEPQGGWSLVSCTVSPGFSFSGFTLAAPGFDIPRG